MKMAEASGVVELDDEERNEAARKTRTNLKIW
jgi:hypothetical protein